MVGDILIKILCHQNYRTEAEISEMTTFTHLWAKLGPISDPKSSYIHKVFTKKTRPKRQEPYWFLLCVYETEEQEWKLWKLPFFKTIFDPNRAQTLAPNPPQMDFWNTNFNLNFVSMEEIILITILWKFKKWIFFHFLAQIGPKFWPKIPIYKGGR